MGLQDLRGSIGAAGYPRVAVRRLPTTERRPSLIRMTIERGWKIKPGTHVR